QRPRRAGGAGGGGALRAGRALRRGGAGPAAVRRPGGGPLAQAAGRAPGGVRIVRSHDPRAGPRSAARPGLRRAHRAADRPHAAHRPRGDRGHRGAGGALRAIPPRAYNWRAPGACIWHTWVVHAHGRPRRNTSTCISPVALLLLLSACVAPGMLTDGTSVSMGTFNAGVLRHGKRLMPQGEGYLIPRLWRDRGASYTTDEFAAAIRRASRRV